jgi:hypothetical protein
MTTSLIITSRGLTTCAFVLLVATSVFPQPRHVVGMPVVAHAPRETATAASSALLSTLTSQPPLRPATLRRNLHVADNLADVVERMWERSPTFRRQCARLANAPLSVTLRMGLRRGSERARAHTLVTREAGKRTVADITIDINYQKVELIGHELEHLIEQLDGVDLAAQVVRRVARRTDAGHYETQRAIQVGRRVAKEVKRFKEPPGGARVAGKR